MNTEDLLNEVQQDSNLWFESLLKIYSKFINLECGNFDSNFGLNITSQQLKNVLENPESTPFCWEGYDEEKLCRECRGNIELLRILCSQQRQIIELKQEIIEIKNIFEIFKSRK